MEGAWMWAGGAALLTAVTAGWGYLRGLLSHIRSRVVMTSEVIYPYGARSMLLYLREHYTPSRFGPRGYAALLFNVREINRTQLVAFETVSAYRLFWRGWWPVIVSLKSRQKDGMPDPGTPEMLSLTYLRGTLDVSQMMSDAVAYFNEVIHDGAAGVGSRYTVHHVFGTAGMLQQQQSGQPVYSNSGSPAAVGSTDLTMDYRHMLPLDHEWSELGPERPPVGRALDHMALSEDSEQLLREIKRWYESEDWYRARSIHWRRGVRLDGDPGTGKTSLVRGIAQDLDMPVYVYHLNTLRDHELQREWDSMLSQAPVVAVVEDIDTVFDGRETIKGELSFGCLLNCIDGISKSEGVLLFVTTNCPDKLDPALGGKGGDYGSTRPGRIDRVLTLGPPDRAGRYKICRRILCDWPDVWDEIVDAGDGETGAQFQQRCIEYAENRFWEEPGESLHVA